MRRYDVARDLRLQRVEAGKLHFVSQLVQETHIEVRAVNLGGEIKEVNFENRANKLIGARPDAEVGYAPVRPAVQPVTSTANTPSSGGLSCLMRMLAVAKPSWRPILSPCTTRPSIE